MAAALAAAFAAKSPALVGAFQASDALPEAHAEAALTAAALMGMNNVWYPFVEMAGRPGAQIDARRAADERLRDARGRRSRELRALRAGGVDRRQMRLLRGVALPTAAATAARRPSSCSDVGRIAAVIAAAAQVLAAEARGGADSRRDLRLEGTAAIAADGRDRHNRGTRFARAFTDRTCMARKRPSPSSGTIVVLEFDSRILRDNPLGDPHVRKVGGVAAARLRQRRGARHQERPGRRYPVLYDLVGYTGSGLAHLNWRPFDENVPGARGARSRMIAGWVPRIVVFPDCFTSMGGNQYINTSAMGRYADYLTHELVPFVDREFRTLAAREHRGVFGKSSGGYGAMVHGMRYPRCWGASANHSGDALFDFCYLTDWPRTLNELDRHRKRRRMSGPRRRRQGRARRRSRHRRRAGAALSRARLGQGKALRLRGARARWNLAMAATYDPDPKAPLGFRLPFNLETGEIIPGACGRSGGGTTRSTWSPRTEEPEDAALHLHRLRLARPVSPALRRADICRNG